jgi:hypothetical protein
VVASPFKRADEIGFKLSLDFIISLLMLSRKLLVSDWIISCIPPSTIDEVNSNDEVDEDDGDDDDEVDEDGPTGRARMCCRSKPAGEQ